VPILPDPRHERFAQNLAAGMNATAAYEAAGFKANRGNAATLKANQAVSKRVAELQQATADTVGAMTEAKVETETARLRVVRAIYAKLEATVPGIVVEGAQDVKALTDAGLAIEKDERVVAGGVSDRTETTEAGALDAIEGRLARLTTEGRAGRDSPKPH
jgi:hypothetical protein